MKGDMTAYMKKNIIMNKAMAIVALSVAVPLVCIPAQAKTPKALMVMVDGLRADAVENLPLPELSVGGELIECSVAE